MLICCQQKHWNISDFVPDLSLSRSRSLSVCVCVCVCVCVPVGASKQRLADIIFIFEKRKRSITKN